MAYISLYRKYRPQSFADVVGQSHVVRTLTNALSTQRLTHAYLFCGPRGTGKTTVARLLAKGMNCEQGPTATPCNSCDNCKRIMNGSSVDVIEIDGASNRGIDEVRDLRDKARYAPAQGKYRVYIIDEVHMLTTDAFNALLKILEEPPGHVVFIFATTEPHQIIDTILSRCQRFDFKRFSITEIAFRLQMVAKSEGIVADDGVLRLIARHADGSMRDALSVLDQCISYEGNEVNTDVVTRVLGLVPAEQLAAFVQALIDRDLARGLLVISSVLEAGKDPGQFSVDIVEYLRSLMLARAGDDVLAIAELSEEDMHVRKEQSSQVSLPFILRAIDTFSQAARDIKSAVRTKLPLEMAVIRLVGGSEPGSGQEGADIKEQEQQTSMSQPGDGKTRERLEREIEGIDQRLKAIEEMLNAVGDLLTRDDQIPRPDRVGSQTRPAEGEDEIAAVTEAEETAGDTAPSPGEEERVSGHQQEDIEREDGAAGVLGSKTGLEVVREKWEDIMDVLKHNRKAELAAFLQEGDPVRLDNDELLIAFPAGKSFHRESLNRKENRDVVERVCRKVLHREITINCIPEEEQGASTGADKRRPTQTGESNDSPGVSRGISAVSEQEQGGGENETGFDNGTPRDIDTDESLQDGAEPGGVGSSEEPIVATALRLFGGRVVEIRRGKNGKHAKDDEADTEDAE